MSENQNQQKRNCNLKSGIKCCVRSCNISRRDSPNIKLFKFPDADKTFGQIWREKCGIPLQDYDKNLYICNKHFSDTFIGRKKLKYEAIPTLFLDINNPEDFEFPSTAEYNHVDNWSCLKCKSNIKTANYYKKKYLSMLKKYTSLRLQSKQHKRIKKSVLKQQKNNKNQLLTNIDSLSHVGPEAKTLCKLLLDSRPKQYSEDVKNLCLNIYYLSPSVYTLLRDRLNLNLPHSSTLIRWTPIKYLQPGLKNSAFESFKEKIKQLTVQDAHHMVLLFDEMAIRRDLKYNTHLDLIDGYENNGFERSNRIGGQVCVFLLKGLFTSWNTVLNYFITESGLTAELLRKIILEILQILSVLGVKVRVIVCDQGPSNRKSLSLLGVSKEEPYFMFEDKKIFCLYDFPHLLKSLRNGWLQYDLKTPDGIVSFKIIKELWEIERNSRTRMCHKLTQQHIFPNQFEKMRVKYATQIFSRSVQAAIRTICETVGFKNSQKEIAVSTANFVEKVDRVFDSMNSGSLYGSNSFRSAIQINNEAHNCIRDFVNYLDHVEFCDPRKKVYFLDGMRLTLKSVLMLVEEFLNESPDKFFIMTKSLNQDKLENIFAVVRQKGGNNNNPTVAEINHIFSKIISTKILKTSNTSNCENVTYEITYQDIPIADNVHQEYAASNLEHDQNKGIEEEDICEFIDFSDQVFCDLFLNDVFENSAKMNLELLSMRYFVGFVCFKIIPQLNCKKCYEELRKEDEVLTAPSELFIFHKNYQSVTDFGNIVAPSNSLMEVSIKHIIIFKQIFDSDAYKIGIKSAIIKHCMEMTPEWFSEECKEHREKIINYMILILLRKHCNWVVQKGVPKKRKLKIIDN